MKQKFLWIALFALSLGAVSSAKADYFLEFVPQAPFTLGGSTTVDVVLRETRTAGSTSDLGTKATLGGNFRLTWSGSAAFTVSALADHGNQGGRFFDNSTLRGAAVLVLNNGSQFATVEQIDDIPQASDPLGTIVSSIETTLRLGSFVVSGGAIGESINFQMVDFDNSSDDIVLDGGTVLDVVIQYGDIDFSVSAVPEPSSMLLLGSLIGGVGIRQWRRRQLKAKA